eukprot:gnl/MRDRNA2_/MRDRNA2_164710_c0_seq1.p1 gnl/MRDRNA2_/MRDRNA2_164710_c0~~gnl/MRDRNA2_/MRDRNA2_164710_c0_seq1.p1  ORF type:complete len:250 (+),score=31.71 gnl/MRDRNA2_/MRDRNA2_164710_c0_seq1:67-816(+)
MTYQISNMVAAPSLLQLNNTKWDPEYDSYEAIQNDTDEAVEWWIYALDLGFNFGMVISSHDDDFKVITRFHLQPRSSTEFFSLTREYPHRLCVKKWAVSDEYAQCIDTYSPPLGSEVTIPVSHVRETGYQNEHIINFCNESWIKMIQPKDPFFECDPPEVRNREALVFESTTTRVPRGIEEEDWRLGEKMYAIHMEKFEKKLAQHIHTTPGPRYLSREDWKQRLRKAPELLKQMNASAQKFEKEFRPET